MSDAIDYRASRDDWQRTEVECRPAALRVATIASPAVMMAESGSDSGPMAVFVMLVKYPMPATSTGGADV